MQKPIFTLDAETDPFDSINVPAPFLWGIYTGESYHEFKTIEESLNFLWDKDAIVYAHNGGKFDYHFFPSDTFYDGQELMFINGRLAKFKIGLCEFRDSYNILPTPLSAYKKDTIDYSIFTREERRKKKNAALIAEYLRADCVYLHEYVTKFIDAYGMHLTQAAASFKQWQKITDSDPPKSDAGYYHFMSRFYYGGRVQCFKHGDIRQNFEMVDINSAYPHAMLHPHPSSITFKMNTGDIEPQSFYRVKAIADGCFPYRDAEDKLRFPADNQTREYCVTGWELLAAKRTGTVKRLQMLESIHFDTQKNFSPFILHFYNLRKACKAAGDDTGSLFAKLIMNSCYGKFGANPEEYKRYQLADMLQLPRIAERESLKPESEQWTPAGSWGQWGLLERDLEEHKQRFYNVATAASITGCVRAKLFEALQSCRDPLYCDTDSIAARDTSALTRSKELGDWDDVGNFKRALIAGKKMYAFERTKTINDERWKIASKGARMDWKQIERLTRGETVIFEPMAPTFSKHKPAHFVKRAIRMTE